MNQHDYHKCLTLKDELLEKINRYDNLDSLIRANGRIIDAFDKEDLKWYINVSSPLYNNVIEASGNFKTLLKNLAELIIKNRINNLQEEIKLV